MTRRAVIGAIVAAAVVATTAVLAQGAPRRPAAAKILGLRGTADLVSMDADWVAIHTKTEDEHSDFEVCDYVSFWNVRTGKVLRVTGELSLFCAERDSERTGVDYMAFAGRRVVWTNHDGGRSPVCFVYTATVAAPRAREIPECTSDDETGYGSGEDVGAWAGDGPLLVGNATWGDRACDENGCPPHELVRVRRSSLQRLRNGDDAAYVRFVDSGRIALLRDDGDVALLSAAGRDRGVLPFPPKEVQQVAIQGDDLAVKKAQNLASYDPQTGKRRKSWPLKPGSILADIHGGIAVLVRGRRVQLVRLADGHGATFTAAGDVKAAQIEPPGLVYSFNLPKGGPKPGRVVFVSLAAVRKALR